MHTAHKWLWLALALSLALASSCSGGGNTDKQTSSCTLGSDGCSCRDGVSCDKNADGQQLACVSGVCQLPACTPGEVGCACDNGTCGDGLQCSSDSGVERCEVKGCELGSQDCGCKLDRTCGSGLSCVRNTCQAVDCQIGADGCACSASFSCQSGLQCDSTVQICSAVSGCTPGNVGCSCDPWDSCNSGLVCTDGTCQDPQCPAGLAGCACLNGTCGKTANGDQLECISGVCDLSACPAGQPGCACVGGSDCDGEATCVDGLCKLDSCIPGQAGCECLAGGCDVGLQCDPSTNVCVDNTGRVGGPCKEDNTCNRNARCDLTVATPNCVWCELGTHRCQCKDTDVDADKCDPGLSCVNGYCAGDETVQNRTAPDNPTCYTPCQSNLIKDDGTVVECSSEGLMEGCFNGKVCTDGSCTDPNGVRDQCMADADCPDFQYCVKGYCYSQCDSDSDCGDGLTCYKKVCRESCSFDAPCTTPNTVCQTQDSDQGFCMAQSSGSNAPQQSHTQGSVSLSDDVLRLSNTKTSAEVTLLNDTDQYVTFTVTKYDHELTKDNGDTETVTLPSDGSCTGSQCPLWWLDVGEDGAVSQDVSRDVRAAPNCAQDDSCPVIKVAIPSTSVNAVRWQGHIRVESSAGSNSIAVSYIERPSGQWSGQMVYFANFEDAGIDTTAQGTGWLDRDRDLVADSSNGNVSVANGLIQRWGAYRNHHLHGWDEMLAVLTATQKESWKWPSVQQDCRATAIGGACYLYVNPSVGAAEPTIYVQNQGNTPIPTGATTMPIVMNLDIPDPQGNPDRMEGKIVSDQTLHYAGNPAVYMEFSSDPSSAAECEPGFSECVHFLRNRTEPGDEDGFGIDLAVGGRYPAPASGQCATGYELRTMPWEVPGFTDDAYVDSSTGLYRRDWCVDYRLPDYSSPLGGITSDERVENRSLARGNPFPTGQVVPRHVEMLDGAMIDQSTIFILFRETYPSFLGSEDMSAYGYMLLRRQDADLDTGDDDNDGVANAFDGNTMPTNLDSAPALEGAQCSQDILDELSDLLGPSKTLSDPDTDLDGVVDALIDGSTGTQVTQYTEPAGDVNGCTGSGTEVHYLCVETGLFDGGADNTACWGAGAYANDDSCSSSANNACEDGGPNATASSCARGTDVSDCGPRYRDNRVKCPDTSDVVYFSAPASEHDAIVNHACQQSGNCDVTLQNWKTSGAVVDHVDLAWRCETGLSCDDDLLDRRANKIFFKPGSQGAHYTAIRSEIANAFRYKTRFQNREGSNLGFVPSQCVPYSSTTPYCYDAGAIEKLRERVDCLSAIYRDFYSDPNSDPSNTTLFDYLKENYAVRTETTDANGVPLSTPKVVDGFERLYAELLIMLGDDAYTSAFESRFDLAGGSVAGFEGDLFENSSDGLRLSGIAGYEMYKLHQAVQYYSMVLDRFYKLSPIIADALAAGPASEARNFMSADTVNYYFDRLIRASTQRSRAWSEIVKRYQSFNKPKLARRVAIRAYTQTYLESVGLSNLILRVNDKVQGSQRAQLLSKLEDSQRRYRMALLDLANVYQSISDDQTYFGYAPDYIPFPALDASTNTSYTAFDKVYQVALAKLDVARVREQEALSQNRSFDTDEASFQAELTSISRTYENQLADICGTFTASDGTVYPAVTRYAYLDERLKVFDDPCGFAGNGTIHDALAQVELDQLAIKQAVVQLQNVSQQIRIEKARVASECNWDATVADYQYEAAGKEFELDQELTSLDQDLQRAERINGDIDAIVPLGQCNTPAECATGAAAAVIMTGAATALEFIAADVQDKMATKRQERNNIERDTAKWTANKQCDLAKINSNAQVLDMILQLRDLQISLLSAEQKLALTMSQVQHLRQQASRIEDEQAESLQMAINVEAAKNDPNIRIYRNDSVINAERSFDDAIKEAYRLTLVYQYYTSQSYAKLDELFLTRMVTAGDYNLENYIYELHNAFVAFQETYGNPDLRVMTVSLKDDILNIPTMDENGDPLGETQRAARMREKLLDPSMLNKDGYIVVPFSTSMDALSPLTRNHKVMYVEANIQGNDLGDQVGRLYLRQVGTSTIFTVDGNTDYYRFPDRTAVINPFFNSAKARNVNEAIYQNWRMRDRPMVNNDWELVINQRDEQANMDMNLNKLSDITLYVYYTDFTVY